ncbi:MAG: arsenate reductase (glutaredoxin) [Paracoccaceae bacterium]
MIELWHNPRCSKSRQALALLEEAEVDIQVRRYLDTPPTRAVLDAVRVAMGNPPVVDMMRTSEKRFKELGLRKDTQDDVLLDAMAANPILIERPVAILGDKAVIGRPPERVQSLLED